VCRSRRRLAIALAGRRTGAAQKSGGVLNQHWDSPASMSIVEEATYSTVVPDHGRENNLVIYADVPAEQHADDRPDLADSWSWSEDGTELTFQMHPRRQMA